MNAERRATLLVLLATLGCRPAARDTEREANRTEFLLSMKAKCREAGERASAQWRSLHSREAAEKQIEQGFITLKGGLPLAFFSPPEYAYSEDLNTCLYADGGMSVGTTGRDGYTKNVNRHRYVVDVYRNKTILQLLLLNGEVYEDANDPSLCKSEAEFEARKARLF